MKQEKESFVKRKKMKRILNFKAKILFLDKVSINIIYFVRSDMR